MKMTCQICGRPIEANKGFIAHHGYKRPGGWQTASCSGAKQLPYEVSRDAIDRYLHVIEGMIARTKTQIENTEAETVECPVRIRAERFRPSHFVQVNRENFEEIRSEYQRDFIRDGIHSFEACKENRLFVLRRDLNEMVETRAGLLEAAAKWSQTHYWGRTTKEWTAL